MDDELGRLHQMINQLMAQSLAQGAMIRTLVGVIADNSPDWRDTIAEFRMIGIEREAHRVDRVV